MSILTKHRPEIVTTSNTTNRHWPLLAGLALFCLSFGIRLLVFWPLPYPNGWNAYHFLLQAEHFSQSPSLSTADYSLITPLLSLLQGLTADPVLAFKLLCALIPALFTLAIFRLAIQWHDVLPLAVLLGCWSVFSPHLTYVASQHPKELLGLVFFIGFLRSIDQKPPWAYAFLLLAVSTHWMSLACCALYFIIYNLLNEYKRPLLLGMSVLSIVGLSFWGWQLLDSGQYDFPFSLQPQFAPYSFLTEFGSNGMINFEWFLEIADSVLLWGLATYFVFWQQKNHRLLIPLFLLCTCLIFPFLKWDYNGLADMGIFYFVLLPPLLLPLIIRIQKLYLFEWPYILSALFLLGSWHATNSYQPVKHDPNYAHYQQLIDEALPFLKSRNASHLIAHTALCEMINYQKHLPTSSWIPSKEVAPGQLWRLAKDIRRSQLERYLQTDELQYLFELDHHSWIIREDIWQELLHRCAKKKDLPLLEQIQSWRNPQIMK